MAKKKYYKGTKRSTNGKKGNDAFFIGNNYSKHANLPDSVMFKDAYSASYGGIPAIGNELENIRKQMEADAGKAGSDFKKRKA